MNIASNQVKLSPQYLIVNVGDGFTADGTQATEISIKNGQDFPYRVTPKDGIFRLAQSFSPRVYIKATFKKVKDFDSFEDALAFIIKRHNRSCAHMTNWTKIA